MFTMAKILIVSYNSNFSTVTTPGDTDEHHNFRFHLSLSVKIPVDVDRVHKTSLFLVLANDKFSTEKGIHQKTLESKTSQEV